MRSKLTFSALILFFYQISLAQKFKWNPTEKVEDSYCIHYAGTNDKNAFVLSSKITIKHDFKDINYQNMVTLNRKNAITLIKYNAKDYVQISKTPFEFKKELSVFYDAFMIGNTMYFFYTSIENARYVFYADKYNTEGEFQETILLYNPEKTMAQSKTPVNDPHLAHYFTFSFSADKNFLILYGIDGVCTLFDKTLKKVWSNKFEYSYLSDIAVLNDGTVFALGGDYSTHDLLKYDANGKSIVKHLTYDEAAVHNYNLKVSEARKSVYVEASYGIDKKARRKSFYDGMIPPFRMGIKPINTDLEFFARGLFVNAYDIATLAENKSTKIAFSNELLLAISGEKKIEKVTGLDFTYLNNLFFTDDGGVICILQRQYTLSVEKKDNINSINSVTSSYNSYGNIALLKADKSGNTIQKYMAYDIERSPAEMTDYYASASIFYNDKLYIMYNAIKLYTDCYNSNLDIVSNNVEDTYKNHDVALILRDKVKLSDGKCFFWGIYKHRIGSAFVDFD